MTKQEAIEILTEMRDWNDYIAQSDALQMAIDALEQKPCTDAISRQAMLDGLEKYHDGADLHIDGLTYAYDMVCKLPSVSMEKTGRWIEHKSYGISYIECSKCSVWFRRDNLPRNSYCPNCGVKMGVEE